MAVARGSSLLMTGLLAGCGGHGPIARAPAPGSCGARILYPYPTIGERGIVSIYKFTLREPNRRDFRRFSQGLARAGVGFVPVSLGEEQTVLATSRRPLRSEGELFREVRIVCALQRGRTIVLTRYQHSVPPE